MTNAHASRRIVSLQPSVTVILDRLNSLDLLVASTRYCQAVCAGALERRVGRFEPYVDAIECRPRPEVKQLEKVYT
jgi:hypothetical protein